jgi:hypothetical protein
MNKFKKVFNKMKNNLIKYNLRMMMKLDNYNKIKK